MPLDVIRYDLDITGVNPSNLVAGEVHTFDPSTTKLLIPKFGYFYKDSLVIVDHTTNTPLTKAQYICTEYFHNASLKYGKEIVGSILITDDSLEDPVRISYQVLGGENSRSSNNVVEVFYDRLQPNQNIPWDDLTDKPALFKPKPGHIHNASDIHDLGRLMTGLDNVREAITLNKLPSLKALLGFIDKTIVQMELFTDSFIGPIMQKAYDDFKAQFTKLYFGLDNVVNLACSTNHDARQTANIYYKHTDLLINKYMILSALVSFKEVIYESIVNKSTTNIGNHTQKYVKPVKSNLFDMENGANVTYIGMETARGSNIDYNHDLYPEDFKGAKPLTVTKITNGKGHRGGLFNAFSFEDDGMYLGVQSTGVDDDEFANLVSWRKYLIEGTLADVMDVAIRHIADMGNPHQLTKDQILLGLVQNLPVVTKDNIKNMTSAKEYVTMDMLLFFMRIFLQQNAWHVELPEGHKNKFLLDNCQVVFSPCGQCGCSDRSDFQPIPPPPPPPCPEAGTLLRQFCSDSSENEPGEGEEIEVGYNLYGVYTDGQCGEKVELILENSPECGYVEPVLGANTEIRDAHNRLIGMGYGQADIKDPNATVAINNYDGDLVCWIYPKSGEGYDSAVLNGDGSFLGFAVNP